MKNINDTIKLSIWGRDYSLLIMYACYENEEVTTVQIQALKRFVAHPEWIKQSKSIVEKYCKKQVMEDAKNSKKSNIFSYIKPDYLLVKRDTINPRVALMCDYRYDEEHGLAVVFSSDGEVTVGIQDIIL